MKFHVLNDIQHHLGKECTTRGLHPAHDCVISGPPNKLKSTKNFSRMPEILSKNLNFIELFTILQLITIQTALMYLLNDNNIKLHATKRLDKYILFSVFDTCLLKVPIKILSSGALLTN